MFKYLVVLILLPTILQSQSIVWEISQKIDKDPTTDKFSFIIDSDGNPAVVIDGNGSKSMTSSFIKFDSLGNILSYRELSYENRISSISFYETDNGYKFFCLTDSADKLASYKISLPLIINTDKNGDSINSIEPYNLKLPEIYKKYGTKLYSWKTSSLTANHNFYNAYIENKVEIDSTNYKIFDHLIISAYDSLGNYLWRKGYDTLKGSVDKYFIRNIRLSKTNTILAVIQYSKRINGKYEHSCKIIETDLEGNLQKTMSYSPVNSSVVPVDIAGLEDGSIIILGEYTGSDVNNNFLVKLNSNGEVLKKIDIPLNGIYDNLEGMSLSPSGGIVIYGTSKIDGKNPETEYDDISKMYLAKISINFDFEWQYIWHEHTFNTASRIMSAEFLDENNIIAVGFKDIFNIFCAKISLLPTRVDENISHDLGFSIYPNPATNFVDIKLYNEASLIASGKVQIFDILGIEVMSESIHPLTETHRMNIERLPAGVYYIKIGTKAEKFMKM